MASTQALCVQEAVAVENGVDAACAAMAHLTCHVCCNWSHCAALSHDLVLTLTMKLRRMHPLLRAEGGHGMLLCAVPHSRVL